MTTDTAALRTALGVMRARWLRLRERGAPKEEAADTSLSGALSILSTAAHPLGDLLMRDFVGTHKFIPPGAHLASRILRARLALYIRALLRAERGAMSWPARVEVDQWMAFYGPNATGRAAEYARSLRLVLPHTDEAFAAGLHEVRVVLAAPLWTLARAHGGRT